MPKLSREIVFTNKVITEGDLSRLVDIFNSLIIKSRPKSNFYSEQQIITISTTTAEGVEYAFNESELKELDGHFQQKRIRSLTASYVDNKTDNRVSFQLKINTYSSCYFQLSSKKEIWLNNNTAIFNEFLDSLKPQENFYLTNRKWIRPVGQFLLALPMTYVFLRIVILVLTIFIPPSHTSLDSTQRAQGLVFLGMWLLVINWIIGGTIVSRFFKYLDELWPPIEIVTGPAHSNKLQTQRKFWSLLLQVIIFPVVISMLFYVVDGLKLF